MIRNVVLHLVGDQPMMADVQALPTATDMCLVCTNLRMMDGRKPVSIDHTDSVFLIPLQVVRFIEITRASIKAGVGGTAPQQTRDGLEGDAASEPSAASLTWYPEEAAVPVAAAQPEEVEPEDDMSDESFQDSDEELLRRIREA